MSNAGWTNFPLAVDNTNAYNWEACVTNWLQLIEAIKERGLIADGNTNFAFVDNYEVPAGYTNAVVATNGTSFINRILCYTNITMTNLTKRAYTYTDAEGLHTATGWPYIKQSQIVDMDARLMTLIPYFVLTNQAVSGTFTEWFDKGASTNHPTDFPMAIPASLFEMLQIGKVTNVTRDSYEVITNGEAYFTRYPMTTNSWLLYESTYTGGIGWKNNYIQEKGLRYYETIPPNAVYHLGGSVTQTVTSFTISGTEIITSNQAGTNVSETIVLSTATTALSKIWYNVTNITTTSAGANTGDVLSIVYQNPHAVHGEHPYQIFAVDLDERWKVLDALRWTRKNVQAYGELHSGWTPDIQPTGGLSPNTWASAMGGAEAHENTNSGSAPDGKIAWGYLAIMNPDEDKFWLAVKQYVSNHSVHRTGVNIDGWTNFYADATIYVKPLSNDVGVQLNSPLHGTIWASNVFFSLQGDTFVEEGKYKLQVETYTANGSNQTIYFGLPTNHTWNTAAEWPPQPPDFTWETFTHYEPWLKGYHINAAKVLFKWDADSTNGIKWK